MRRVVIDPEVAYAHLKNRVNWALCDKCGWYWPETLLNERDGRKVCPNHSTFRESRQMRDAKFAKLAARLANQKEPIPKWPAAPEMRGVSAVYAPAPFPLQAIRNPIITVNSSALGRNLTGAEVITTTAPNVAFTPTGVAAIDPETRGNSINFTIVAGAVGPLGLFNVTIGDQVFPCALEVLHG